MGPQDLRQAQPLCFGAKWDAGGEPGLPELGSTSSALVISPNLGYFLSDTRITAAPASEWIFNDIIMIIVILPLSLHVT